MFACIKFLVIVGHSLLILSSGQQFFDGDDNKSGSFLLIMLICGASGSALCLHKLIAPRHHNSMTGIVQELS